MIQLYIYMYLGMCAQSGSRVRLFATQLIATCQAPVSRDFSRQEYWSGLPCPPPGSLPDSEIEPMSHACCLGRRALFPTSTTREAPHTSIYSVSSHLGYYTVLCAVQYVLVGYLFYFF